MLFHIKHTILYWRYALIMLFQCGKPGVIFIGLRLFPQWMKDYRSGTTTVSRRMPWINYDARDYLDRIVKPDMSVFEWGSGGSTLYWSDYCAKVYSVEHDKEWYTLLSGVLASEGNGKVTYKNILPEKDDKKRDYKRCSDFASASIPGNWFPYVSQISTFPDASLDIILIDGRARNACVNSALDKLKKGGILIVDNSDRKHCTAEFTNLFESDGWTKREFIGPAPFQHAFTKTSFYFKN